MFQTLITATDLERLRKDDAVHIIDCRFQLAEKDAGRRDYCDGHIPGAVFADLERDLSGPACTDVGRHPMPAPARMTQVFSCLGIASGRQVVAYDDAGGMVAARLWWMLRYLSHEAVAVLDGGLDAWRQLGVPFEGGATRPARSAFHGDARPERLVTLEQVPHIDDLVDAREARRFRGEIEPLDRVAGHIPNAHNHCFKDNLDGDGCFLSAANLRQAFEASLGTLPNGESVHYCGSGVSACHNILAQVHAGLDEPRLYCGSWSEWCADPNRPVAVDPEL